MRLDSPAYEGASVWSGWSAPGYRVLDDRTHAMGAGGVGGSEDGVPLPAGQAGALVLPVNPPDGVNAGWEPSWRMRRRGRHVAEVEAGTASSSSTGSVPRD